MLSARRHRTVKLVALAAVGAFVALAACSNNAEGERCDVNNGNDDCQDGLVCVAAKQLPQGDKGGDRCCPPDRAQASTATCAQQTSPTGVDAAPSDTGPAPDVVVTDAPQDTGSDAADAAADATDATDADDSG